MRHISLSTIALSSCKIKIIVCYDVLGNEESLLWHGVDFYFRCKKNDVPIEKIYNKTQRQKFQWAIDMTDEDFVF